MWPVEILTIIFQYATVRPTADEIRIAANLYHQMFFRFTYHVRAFVAPDTPPPHLYGARENYLEWREFCGLDEPATRRWRLSTHGRAHPYGSRSGYEEWERHIHQRLGGLRSQLRRHGI